jgi:PAS domain-containing protein
MHHHNGTPLLTLWRGDQLLGELRTRAPDPYEPPRRRDRPQTLSAILVAAPKAQPMGVWQVQLPLPGSSSIHQYPVEPDIVAERGRHGSVADVNPGFVALQPMSPEEAKGVPRDIQLTLRDAGGRVHLPLQIRLQELRYEPEHYEIALREVPAEALMNGSIWWAFVVFASEIDLPGT